MTSMAVMDEIITAEKVVIQCGDRTIKGLAGVDGLASVEQLMRNPKRTDASVRLRLQGSEEVEDFPLENIKAIFLVKTFDGNSRRNPLHFHDRTPVIQGLWVRVEFDDQEVMEGIVHNTGSYVMEPGFLLIPTDPGSNNKLVYVLKKNLRNFEVLGIRNPPRGQTSF